MTPSMLRDLLTMARPRIMVMSAAAITAGFVLASPEQIQWLQLVISIAGICCFVAASSVLNQVYEAASDGMMQRTAGRPVASGRVTTLQATAFGAILIVSGFTVLTMAVNLTVAAASLATMVCYVAVYTPLKRTSEFCTTVGAIPGAMPPVLGWLASGREAGWECLALFAIFFVWQFPHFLAIGWIYREQYQAAGLRMLPSFHDGGQRTGWIALIYALAFVPVTTLPRFIGLAGGGYLSASLVLSLGYLWLTFRFFRERTDQRARQLMAGSLICLPVLLGCLVLDYLRLTA